MKKTKVVEVSQFFDYRSMRWSELIKEKKKGVLPSTDKTCFLWIEKPTIRLVDNNDKLYIGEVWLKEGNNDTIEIFKANYDTSD
jgi:hypothetical protein